MDRLPEAFERVVTYGPGEQFLGCWHGIEVYLERSGRAITGGDMDAQDPVHGLLVLSNYRLRHYVFVAGYRAFFEAAPVPISEPDETIPVGCCGALTLFRHPAFFGLLLWVREIRSLSLGGVGHPSTPVAGMRDHYLLVSEKEDPQGLYERLVAAAELAGSELVPVSASGAPALMDTAKGPTADPPEGPVHLHAEQEPED
jgi:hypothetical protein